MPTDEWRELLGRSGLRDISRADIERQFASLPATAAIESVGGAYGGSGNQAQGKETSLTSQDLAQHMSSLVSQLSNLNATQLNQISALEGNTQALAQNTTSRASSGPTVGSTLLGTATSLLGGGLTLAPLISGLEGLFGGGGSSAPAPAPYMLPAPVQYQAGLTGGSGESIGAMDYGQAGQPRQISSSSATSVTVQVNAMDSRSFLDHSDEIANAIRAAILNSHPLNDVLAGI